MNPTPDFAVPDGAAPPILRLDAHAITDAHSVMSSPGSLLVGLGGDGCTVLAAGAPETVDRHPDAPRAARHELPGTALLPGLVNAHSHLDLTHIGPRPHNPADGFDSWLNMILRERLHEEPAIRDSVLLGAELSLRGGVVAVGDIAGIGKTAPALALRDSPLHGVSYIELFGTGDRQEGALAAARETLERVGVGEWPVRVGLSPHAPYTAGLRLYEGVCAIARDTGAPLCTHLAESIEERDFIERAEGGIRTLLERVGFWSDAMLDDVGRGAHPIAHLAPVLRSGRWLLAHVNDCPDEMLPALASTGASVVWCPRGWTYFGRGNALGPHRWKDMLAAGVNVALGTDSIVNLPADESDRLSTLDEARCLRRREGADARTLLAMITTNGARAIGMDPSRFTFAPGTIAGVIGVPLDTAARSLAPIDAVMDGAAPPETLLVRGRCSRRLLEAVAR